VDDDLGPKRPLNKRMEYDLFIIESAQSQRSTWAVIESAQGLKNYCKTFLFLAGQKALTKTPLI